MKNIESLLRQVDDTPELSANFIPRVMRSIEQSAEVHVTQAILWSFLVGAAGFICFYVTSSLVIHVFDSTLPDLWMAFRDDPSLIKIPEIRAAIRQDLPYGTIVALGVSVWALFSSMRRLVRAMPSLPFLQHAYA